MSTIELRNVSRVHATPADTVEAVSGVDLTIADGEFFTLIGPSGCGKSTLLRLVAGVDRPSSGDVLLDGAIVNHLAARHRDVAMVFQASALYPNMSIAENIGFSLKVAGADRRSIRRQVQEMADMLGIADVLDRHPHQLSGGQRQRVAIGRMLIRHPHLFLMDEPMSSLDAKLRHELRTEFARLQRRLHITTMYATHDQVEAMSMADRLAVMRRGRIVQCDSPTAVYAEPHDLFVAQFLGSPPMNAWTATVEATPRGATLRWRSSTLPLDDATLARFGGVAHLTGREVIIGLRPDAFTPHPNGPLIVSPGYSEVLGTHQLVHCSLPATGVVATDDGLTHSAEHCAAVVVALKSTESFTVWEPLRLDVDLGRLHLFDIVDGRSLATTSNRVFERPNAAR